MPSPENTIICTFDPTWRAASSLGHLPQAQEQVVEVAQLVRGLQCLGLLNDLG